MTCPAGRDPAPGLDTSAGFGQPGCPTARSIRMGRRRHPRRRNGLALGDGGQDEMSSALDHQAKRGR